MREEEEGGEGVEREREELEVLMGSVEDVGEGRSCC